MSSIPTVSQLELFQSFATVWTTDVKFKPLKSYVSVNNSPDYRLYHVLCSEMLLFDLKKPERRSGKAPLRHLKRMLNNQLCFMLDSKKKNHDIP